LPVWRVVFPLSLTLSIFLAKFSDLASKNTEKLEKLIHTPEIFKEKLKWLKNSLCPLS
jgi:hypothetical protein